MKPHHKLTLLILALFGLVACTNRPETPAATPLPPAPTVAGDGQELPPTESASPSPTSPALDTVAPSPTVEAVTEEPPTVAPEPTSPPAPTATAEPTAEPEPSPTPPPTAVSIFGPGQQDAGTLAAGSAQPYLVQGTRFEPLILFVDPENELDVALAAFTGDVTGQATDGLTPLVAADNALTGRPEIIVLSPEADGLHTFVVRAAAGQGSFAAYLYDLTTPAPGMAVQQSGTLAAGAQATFNVQSNGARPVLAIADPTDQSDIALDILGADGALLTTANFSGAGGVETAYVLPLGTTAYTVVVREVNGVPADFQIAVITLE